MKKVPTAKELYLKTLFPTSFENKRDEVELWFETDGHAKEHIEVMIEFAKMHVKLSKNEINSNILHKELSVDWDIFDESGMLLLDDDGIKDFKKTVSSSYQLKNIK
jgi:hypothetical protein